MSEAPEDVVDLEADPERAAVLCTSAQRRLLAAVTLLDDVDVARASRLPGWSVGHVLTHLARNADAHTRRLAGALRGEDVGKYPGGETQRAHDIAVGAGRSARELVADLAQSQQRLEQVFTACSAAGWPGGDLLGGSHYPATGCPAHRLREVDVHASGGVDQSGERRFGGRLVTERPSHGWNGRGEGGEDDVPACRHEPRGPVRRVDVRHRPRGAEVVGDDDAVEAQPLPEQAGDDRP